MKFTFKLDNKGFVRQRESFDLEYKQNFQGGDNLLKYIKTLVGMANNKGGEIIFGIKDKPHLPLGMTNTRFRETDPKDIDSKIREFFSQEIKWKSETITYNGNDYGVISVEESYNKPIICTKNKDNILREASIYYRYRAETKEIEYAELRDILDKEREKERILWMQHIQKIALIGPRNVHLLDSFKGEINVGNGRILIDKNVIDKLIFIREGKFTEKEGAPALRLLGDISGIVDPEVAVSSDILYPLFTEDLQTKLNLNSYQISAVLWKLRIKGNQKYHTENKPGKKSNPTNKYTENLIQLIERMLKRPDFLKTSTEEYAANIKQRRKPLDRRSVVRPREH